MLAKELETINWVFVIENKIVNTTTNNCFNFVRPLNIHEETATNVEEKALMKKDQVVPAVIMIKTRYNCYPFLKEIMMKKGLEYSCQNICVVHHTFLILWRLLMLARF